MADGLGPIERFKAEAVAYGIAIKSLLSEARAERAASAATSAETHRKIAAFFREAGQVEMATSHDHLAAAFARLSQEL